MYLTRLKDLREDSDMNQTFVAKVINCSQTCYSKYELGQREIPLTALCKLADFYHTSTDYILGRTSNKKAYPAFPKPRKHTYKEKASN